MIKARGFPQESYEEAQGQLVPDIYRTCPHGSIEPSSFFSQNILVHMSSLLLRNIKAQVAVTSL